MCRFAGAVIVLALLLPGTAAASRPSVDQARSVTRVALQNFAAVVDGKLVVGECDPRGHRSRRCGFKIKGRQSFHGRTLVTSAGADFVARAWIYPGLLRQR